MPIKKPIDISKLPGNHRDTPGQPKEQNLPVLRGGVKEKSKPGLAGDIRDISIYLMEDIIVPNLKTIVRDFIASGVEMLLWGERSEAGGSSRTNYHSAYSRNRNASARVPSSGRRQSSFRGVRENMSVDEVYFTYRQDAEKALAYLLELVAEYRWASVGDFMQVIGRQSTNHHESYGWSSLRDVGIVRTADGYILDLPDPVYRD